MKFRLFLAPENSDVTPSNTQSRKRISGVVTSFMMAGLTLLVPLGHKQTRRPRVPKVNANAAKRAVANPGLTRNRPAFNKAISMLADRAATDSNLAEYYRSVTTRVKGASESAEADLTSTTNTAPAKISNRPAASLSRVAGVWLSSEVSAPRAVDAPLEEPEPSRQRGLTAGDLDFETNAAVERWMSYYSSSPIGRRTMQIGMERSNAYLEMARADFREAGVPEDLVWLAFVESVWNPRAASSASACGLWQFIPATATEYGLKVGAGSDERQDPEKQTRVAAVYLHDLYTIFGDWALAMAAYNSGEPRVMGAILKNGRADFWELYEKQLLPKETLDYVPKILASIRVVAQAEYYGLTPESEKEFGPTS